MLHQCLRVWARHRLKSTRTTTHNHVDAPHLHRKTHTRKGVCYIDSCSFTSFESLSQTDMHSLVNLYQTRNAHAGTHTHTQQCTHTTDRCTHTTGKRVQAHTTSRHDLAACKHIFAPHITTAHQHTQRAQQALLFDDHAWFCVMLVTQLFTYTFKYTHPQTRYHTVPLCHAPPHTSHTQLPTRPSMQSSVRAPVDTQV